MDLGAMVCRPAAPSCHTCPLATACVAFRDGLTDQLPRMAKPRASVAVDEVALVVVRRNTLLLVQRGEDEWWAGLWDVPRAAPPRGSLLRTARREGRLLGEVRYGVTHHRIRADVVLLHAGKGNTLDQLGIPWPASRQLIDGCLCRVCRGSRCPPQRVESSLCSIGPITRRWAEPRTRNSGIRL